MLMYSQYVAHWSNYRRGWEWQRLPGAEHGALADCRAALEVLRTMAAETPDEAYRRSVAEKNAERKAKHMESGLSEEEAEEEIKREDDRDFEDMVF